MFTRISFSRFEVYSLYKIVFIGLSCSLVPLAVFFGVFALFGANTVHWNGQPLHGWTGFLVSPLIGLITAIGLTAFAGTACAFGLWLFSKFKPLSLWGKDVAHHKEDGT